MQNSTQRKETPISTTWGRGLGQHSRCRWPSVVAAPRARQLRAPLRSLCRLSASPPRPQPEEPVRDPSAKQEPSAGRAGGPVVRCLLRVRVDLWGENHVQGHRAGQGQQAGPGWPRGWRWRTRVPCGISPGPSRPLRCLALRLRRGGASSQWAPFPRARVASVHSVPTSPGWEPLGAAAGGGALHTRGPWAPSAHRAGCSRDKSKPHRRPAGLSLCPRVLPTRRGTQGL